MQLTSLVGFSFWHSFWRKESLELLSHGFGAPPGSGGEEDDGLSVAKGATMCPRIQ